eukprot:CAMPEP_0202917346 /NCGR_PEP_ID=MMETSP1392-20130828/70782_1 /ASSEMBLY_ACC=CAM_ASM_000868 /TAXON_ID=225041 /ORGANISM="Chlamydomonas chlamydogama, Strain SAG 11-48b" /LENGTH=499 /DNA_ID=CAMNT_0049610073 /DNA_START=34 /DNA_END=1533 /DNA_ORIENTATION=+
MDICESAPLEIQTQVTDDFQECSTSLSPTKSDADKNAGKKKTKGQASNTSVEFASVLSNKIEELEKNVVAGNAAEREAAKLRKKQLREVLKYVSDKQNSDEDRVTYIQSKYTQQVTEFLRMEKHYLEVQRDLEVVTKERDKVQTELKKANALRDKLEELCRQLQKENREVVEESKRRCEDEMKHRQALQTKFSAALNDVAVKMDQQHEERVKQMAENDALKVKLGEVVAQFDTFTALLNKKDLEVQLAAAKLEQQQEVNKQLAARSELLQQANEQLSKTHEAVGKELEGCIALKEQNAVLMDTNKELRAQLDSYFTKFAEFQSTLTKSNQMFDGLKKEIEKQHKVRATLSKERDDIRKRAEKAEAGLVALVEENSMLKKQVERQQSGGSDGPEEVRKLRVQKEKLEGLCRALQAQIKELKGAGSSSSSTAAAAPARGEGDGPAGEGEGNKAEDASVPEQETRNGEQEGSGSGVSGPSSAPHTPDPSADRMTVVLPDTLD